MSETSSYFCVKGIIMGISVPPHTHTELNISLTQKQLDVSDMLLDSDVSD